MNRAQATIYLADEFSAQITETGMAATDTAAGFGPAIDNALRALGTVEADLATADIAFDDLDDYQALLEYFTLKRLVKKLAGYADVKVDEAGIAKSKSQIFKQTKILLDMAQSDIEARGYGNVVESWQMGRINFDIYEPEEVY